MNTRSIFKDDHGDSIVGNKTCVNFETCGQSQIFLFTQKFTLTSSQGFVDLTSPHALVIIPVAARGHCHLSINMLFGALAERLMVERI